MACEIATTGAGREYELTGPWAFWRNFAAIRPDDEAAVLDFIRRRGDPFNELSPDTPTDTADWPSVAVRLRPLASFWSDADNEGISNYLADDARRIALSKDIIAAPVFKQSLGFDIRIDNDTGKLNSALKTHSLAGFMLASALLHLNTGQPMAVCANCGDWFAMMREGTRFCSASCRAMHSTRKEKK